MTVKFTPSYMPPLNEDAILLNDHKIGTVTLLPQLADKERYHAVIRINAMHLCPDVIQGFGYTKEEAVNNAITTGLETANSMLEIISKLKSEMEG